MKKLKDFDFRNQSIKIVQKKVPPLKSLNFVLISGISTKLVYRSCLRTCRRTYGLESYENTQYQDNI